MTHPNPSAWGAEQTKFFFALSQDQVLDAVERTGLRTTGRCMALNSMENRVYDVEIDFDDAPPKSIPERFRIAKFYRPGRWSKEQILEEHRFLAELRETEIPVVCPIVLSDGQTLATEPKSQIQYCLFPKIGGRAPDELDDDQLLRVGRLLGRIHHVGQMRDAPSRVRLTPEIYGIGSLEVLESLDCMPTSLADRFADGIERIADEWNPVFDHFKTQRIHGDCHLGNLLWSPEGATFLDFDDHCVGPCVQDLWLLLPGRSADSPESKAALDILLQGYESFHPFDRRELEAIECLRVLRQVHFAAWIGKRWEDPAFPRNFPQFESHRYWEELLRDVEALDSPR